MLITDLWILKLMCYRMIHLVDLMQLLSGELWRGLIWASQCTLVLSKDALLTTSYIFLRLILLDCCSKISTACRSHFNIFLVEVYLMHAAVQNTLLLPNKILRILQNLWFLECARRAGLLMRMCMLTLLNWLCYL